MKYSIAYVDSKNVCPKDKICGSMDESEFNKHYNKPIRGEVVISNARTGEVIERPNLVLLSGREFIAQKLANISSDTLINLEGDSEDTLENYKIRYFGIGSGGASPLDGTNKVGPYDSDVDLVSRQKFNNMQPSENSGDAGVQYLHEGYLKHIQSDNGRIEIISEKHTIDNNTGQDVYINAMTTIKYTLFIKQEELFKESKPFPFNEAALYAVEYDDEGKLPKANSKEGKENSIWNARYRTFARFTTSTKLLEHTDSLKIEWYILC